LADRAQQVVDGAFSGYDPGAGDRWVIVQVVDSSFYVVHSDNDEVLGILCRTYRDVSPRTGPVC
jgi:hypothetical protein